MRHFLLIFLVAAAAPAQIISVGIEGGVPANPALTEAGNDNPSLNTGKWTAGPSIEFHLFRGLSFDSGFLFRRYSSNTNSIAFSTGSGTLLVYYHSSVANFDFPFLLRYHFGSGSRRPFVEGGFVWTHQTFDTYLAETCVSAVPCQPASFGQPNNSPANRHGGAAGVGEEFKYHRMRISPEIRFTYYPDFGQSPKQLAVLLGISF